MKNSFIWIKSYFYPLLLTLIVGILVGANYTPGTFLSGWDTLHPEFNLPLAFSRALTGVWRTDQGLGAVAGHSHMADLPHLIIIWVLSLIEPSQLIRYSFIFLCLLGGVFGMYSLLKHFFVRIQHCNSLAFFGTLAYLTNLGTVQQFIVPLEMFTVQYALLPWILLTATGYSKTPDRKHLFWFILTLLLASPMAYAATLWYAFFALFTLYILWTSKRIKLLVTTILVNIYWIFPNIYFVLFHGKDVELSKVNQLFSSEAFAKNQEFGNIANVPLLKNFLFDWQLYSKNTLLFTNVMDAWQVHLHNPIVISIGIVVFMLAVLGLIRVFLQKNVYGQAFAIIFFITGLILLNGTWPMTTVFEAIGNVSSVLKEALRFPFTKFSIFYMLSMSVLATHGLAWIIEKWNTHVAKTGILILCAGLLYFYLPAFTGNLIQPAMRITIPQEYFDMFAWFKTQPADQRVAILPIHSFWNWTYYRWGYQGAGFLQFGIPQPILDRDYDRWSPYNEQYEKEMSYAIYSQNPDNIRVIIAKYNASWILVDNSVFAPASNENQTLLWLLPELLQKAGFVKTKTFGNDITIYRADTAQSVVSGYINAPESGLLNPYFSLVNTNERIIKPISGKVVAEGKGREYRSTNTPDTDHIDIPTLDHNSNYVLEITSKHTSGFPLQLCVSNSLTSHCDLSVHLGTQSRFMTERFLLPNLSDLGMGYNLNFNNFTIQGMTSINEIQSIRVSELEDAPIAAQGAKQSIQENVTQLLSILYRVKITSPTKTLVLHQSFEQGWIAYNSTKKTILTHSQINAWANGWTGNFNTGDIIYILFWPQLLEII